MNQLARIRTALIAVLLAGPLFASPITYSVSTIPPPADYPGSIGVTGINESGQVSGFGYNVSTNQLQAFIASTSGGTAIPLISGWSGAYGEAINDSGQVAGTVIHNGADQAFIGTTSGSELIPLVSGWEESDGTGINASGQVTGYGYYGSNVQTFIGTASGSTAIPLVSGWTQAYGEAINNSGQVAGYLYNPSTTLEQAFIGTTSGSTAIPLPAGATSAFVSSESLNDAGVVVGDSSAGGWLWDASDGTVLLNTLVPTGWNISGAIAISNNGLILAEGSYDGGNTQYLELDPNSYSTPEPATIFLAGTGFWLALALPIRKPA